jgi:hypothetical protein
MLASLVLIAAPDGKLIGMDKVALGARFVACLVPVGAGILERRVRARKIGRASKDFGALNWFGTRVASPVSGGERRDARIATARRPKFRASSRLPIFLRENLEPLRFLLLRRRR